MIKDLIKIANELDKRRLSKEADYLDNIIYKRSDSLEDDDLTDLFPPNIEDCLKFDEIIGGGSRPYNSKEIKEEYIVKVFREKDPDWNGTEGWTCPGTSKYELILLRAQMYSDIDELNAAIAIYPATTDQNSTVSHELHFELGQLMRQRDDLAEKLDHPENQVWTDIPDVILERAKVWQEDE